MAVTPNVYYVHLIVIMRTILLLVPGKCKILAKILLQHEGDFYPIFVQHSSESLNFAGEKLLSSL